MRADIGEKETRVVGEDEAEEGREGRDPGGDTVALSLEIGGVDRGEG